jgi:hypothetical protein
MQTIRNFKKIPMLLHCVILVHNTYYLSQSNSIEMKKQLLKSLMVAGLTTFFFACSSGGGDKAAEADNTEATEEAAEETSADAAVTEETRQMVLVWHMVEDYNTWRPIYDGNLPNIQDGGMTRVVVGREHGNDNHIMVAHSVQDLAAARSFLESEDLKAKMEEGGVTGEPEISIVDVVEYDGAYMDNLERVGFMFRVADWDKFMEVFSAGSDEEIDNGMDFLFMGRGVDDPNMVHAVFVLTDREKVEAYMNGEKVAADKEAATVEGEMRTRYFTAEYIDDSES